MVRRDRGHVPSSSEPLAGTGTGTGSGSGSKTGTGSGAGAEIGSSGTGTEDATGPEPAHTHRPRDQAAYIAGTGTRQMVRFFTYTTTDRLAGIPRTTNKPKDIERRRDRSGDGHQQETITIRSSG